MNNINAKPRPKAKPRLPHTFINTVESLWHLKNLQKIDKICNLSNNRIYQVYVVCYHEFLS